MIFVLLIKINSLQLKAKQAQEQEIELAREERMKLQRESKSSFFIVVSCAFVCVLCVHCCVLCVCLENNTLFFTAACLCDILYLVSS